MPFDRRRYPADWEEIRAEILDRAGNRCEQCNVENGRVGHRAPRTAAFSPCAVCESGAACDERAIRIVLTIAHLVDMDPMAVDRANLAALCQRCHLQLDGPLHARNAALTRRRNRIAAGQGLLMED